MVDDVIMEFGSIKKTNFSSLRDISAVVGHSQGVSDTSIIPQCF